MIFTTLSPLTCFLILILRRSCSIASKWNKWLPMDLSLLKIEMWQHNKLKLSIIVEAISTRAAFHTRLLRCSLLLSLPCIRHHFDISLDPIMHSALRQLLVIRCLRWWRPACRIDANPITRVTRLRLSIQTLCASPDGPWPVILCAVTLEN